jgi:hypothetical protein
MKHILQLINVRLLDHITVAGTKTWSLASVASSLKCRFSLAPRPDRGVANPRDTSVSLWFASCARTLALRDKPTFEA